jgi:hypothetical protein
MFLTVVSLKLSYFSFRTGELLRVEHKPNLSWAAFCLWATNRRPAKLMRKEFTSGAILPRRMRIGLMCDKSSRREAW